MGSESAVGSAIATPRVSEHAVDRSTRSTRTPRAAHRLRLIFGGSFVLLVLAGGGIWAAIAVSGKDTAPPPPSAAPMQTPTPSTAPLTSSATELATKPVRQGAGLARPVAPGLSFAPDAPYGCDVDVVRSDYEDRGDFCKFVVSILNQDADAVVVSHGDWVVHLDDGSYYSELLPTIESCTAAPGDYCQTTLTLFLKPRDSLRLDVLQAGERDDLVATFPPHQRLGIGISVDTVACVDRPTVTDPQCTYRLVIAGHTEDLVVGDFTLVARGQGWGADGVQESVVCSAGGGCGIRLLFRLPAGVTDEVEALVVEQSNSLVGVHHFGK